MIQEALRLGQYSELAQNRFLFPHLDIEQDYTEVYTHKNLSLGSTVRATEILMQMVRRNSKAIFGAQLGDEGKGRITDNQIEALLAIPGVDAVAVFREQGGNNAGHSIEHNGQKLALHVVPSGVFYEKVTGIMDAGVVIHCEDLMTEVTYVEKVVGDTREKLIVSSEAILATDLERAEEFLNASLTEGAKGGTRRGIRPAYAHQVDKTGLQIRDLLADNWKKGLSARYDHLEKIATVYGYALSEILVPDFAESKQQKVGVDRKVGTKAEFLDRLEEARRWLIERNMVQDTYILHRDIYRDLSRGVLFEGAQAIGLHNILGTNDDVTGSATGIDAVVWSRFWRPINIEDPLGVMKATYMSSVGRRRMPTHISLPKVLTDFMPSSEAEAWGAYVREEAHEYGTTTGRPRDICFLDIPFLIYNCAMGGINELAATHMDIAQAGKNIKVCTHYTDLQGNPIPYKPDLEYLESGYVVPEYIELPGWDGQKARAAKSFDELPEEAQQFLAFIQRRTGIKIVAVTTGPAREHMININ